MSLLRALAVHRGPLRFAELLNGDIAASGFADPLGGCVPGDSTAFTGVERGRVRNLRLQRETVEGGLSAGQPFAQGHGSVYSMNTIVWANQAVRLSEAL